MVLWQKRTFVVGGRGTWVAVGEMAGLSAPEVDAKIRAALAALPSNTHPTFANQAVAEEFFENAADGTEIIGGAQYTPDTHWDKAYQFGRGSFPNLPDAYYAANGITTTTSGQHTRVQGVSNEDRVHKSIWYGRLPTDGNQRAFISAAVTGETGTHGFFGTTGSSALRQNDGSTLPANVFFVSRGMDADGFYIYAPAANINGGNIVFTPGRYAEVCFDYDPGGDDDQYASMVLRLYPGTTRSGTPTEYRVPNIHHGAHSDHPFDFSDLSIYTGADVDGVAVIGRDSEATYDGSLTHSYNLILLRQRLTQQFVGGLIDYSPGATADFINLRSKNHWRGENRFDNARDGDGNPFTGPQGAYDFVIYRAVTHAAGVASVAPAKPSQSTYAALTGDTPVIPSGWSQTRPSHTPATEDIYATFARINPANETATDWAAPFIAAAEVGATGPAGAAGMRGPQGERGETGPAGMDFTPLTGSGPPAADLGAANRFYVNTDDDTLWFNDAGTWGQVSGGASSGGGESEAFTVNGVNANPPSDKDLADYDFFEARLSITAVRQSSSIRGTFAYNVFFSRAQLQGRVSAGSTLALQTITIRDSFTTGETSLATVTLRANIVGRALQFSRVAAATGNLSSIPFTVSEVRGWSLGGGGGGAGTPGPAGAQGPQGLGIVRLFNRVAHEASAPGKPTGVTATNAVPPVLSGIPAGWTEAFPTFDPETQDVYEAFAAHNPAAASGSALEFSVPFEVGAEIGPAGPAGAAGAKGADGEAGAPGAKGDTGDTGPKGDPGGEGARGPQGAPGTNGMDGAAGARGPQGFQGQSTIRLYNSVGHNQPAPAMPTGVTADAQGNLSNIPSGWSLAFPTGFDPQVNDVYESFATHNPAAGDNQALSFSAPFEVGAEIGPAGPAGATGPRGPQGEQGETGPRGPAGTGSGTGGVANTSGLYEYRDAPSADLPVDDAATPQPVPLPTGVAITDIAPDVPLTGNITEQGFFTNDPFTTNPTLEEVRAGKVVVHAGGSPNTQFVLAYDDATNQVTFDEERIDGTQTSTLGDLVSFRWPVRVSAQVNTGTLDVQTPANESDDTVPTSQTVAEAIMTAVSASMSGGPPFTVQAARPNNSQGQVGDLIYSATEGRMYRRLVETSRVSTANVDWTELVPANRGTLAINLPSTNSDNDFPTSRTVAEAIANNMGGSSIVAVGNYLQDAFNTAAANSSTGNSGLWLCTRGSGVSLPATAFRAGTQQLEPQGSNFIVPVGGLCRIWGETVQARNLSFIGRLDSSDYTFARIRRHKQWPNNEQQQNSIAA